MDKRKEIWKKGVRKRGIRKNRAKDKVKNEGR